MLVIGTGSPVKLVAEQPIPPPQILKIYSSTTVPHILSEREQIDEAVDEFSKAYSVSKWVMQTIINNESLYNRKAIGDMGIICRRTGRPVRSRGLSMITECYHPEVSDKQAFDIRFSVEFLARGIAAGHCRQQWSTCPI